MAIWNAVLRISIAVVALIFLFYLLTFLEKRFTSKVKSLNQFHNLKIFFRLVNYFILLVTLVIFLFAYVGSWAGLGLGLGFFTAALGWALQKPITGIAAWLIVIAYRPFKIGDRVSIGGVSGDVADIRLTHIYLNEVGGIAAGEENSNRVIMIPNSILFDQNIINYTKSSPYVLDEVGFSVTFSSDIDIAKKIVLDSTRRITQEVIERIKQEPYIRIALTTDGVKLNVRYMSPAVRLYEMSTKVAEEIVRGINSESKVQFAYPHTELVFGNTKSKR